MPNSTGTKDFSTSPSSVDNVYAHKIVPPPVKSTSTQVESATATGTTTDTNALWQPYLSLVDEWLKADASYINAKDKADSTRTNITNSAKANFEAEKTKIAAAKKAREKELEYQNREIHQQAENHIFSIKTIENDVLAQLNEVGLAHLNESLPSASATERSDIEPPLPTLVKYVEKARQIAVEVTENLHEVRIARQRVSAQKWLIGIALWLLSIFLFASNPLISAGLLGFSVFVMAIPRKIKGQEKLRPSFWMHLIHCISLLAGKSQLMDAPFSLIEKTPKAGISSRAFFAGATAFILGWITFAAQATSRYTSSGLSTDQLSGHLTTFAILAFICGTVSYWLVQNITTEQIGS